MTVNDILALENRILSGGRLTRNDALQLAALPNDQSFDLFASANRLRMHYHKQFVELCAIVNAKSGLCPEQCAYCAQSAKSQTGIAVYPLMSRQDIRTKAVHAKEHGVLRFSIVTSGRKPTKKDLQKIAVMIKDIRALGMCPCASLGLLDRDELSFLRDAGLERYHCNIETSERFFPSICTAHSFSDKLNTIEDAQQCGMSICSGGIFGMGETWDDRIDMAMTLRKLDVDSVPVNFLTPIAGTPLGTRKTMHPFEALKVISIFRFVLPRKAIRICGGRTTTLGEFASMIFWAGADALMTGDYLTTLGRSFCDDLNFLQIHGLRPLQQENSVIHNV